MSCEHSRDLLALRELPDTGSELGPVLPSKIMQRARVGWGGETPWEQREY